MNDLLTGLMAATATTAAHPQGASVAATIHNAVGYALLILIPVLAGLWAGGALRTLAARRKQRTQTRQQ